MMLIKRKIWRVIILVALSSCAIRKHLPEGAKLYNGAAVTVNRAPDNKEKTKPVKKTLAGISFPKKNKMILGYPYKVGFWYGIGEGKNPKGFRNWLRNRLGKPPVLSTTVDLAANSENMMAYLENRGYFKSSVSAASAAKGYKMKAAYTVLLTRPYMIDTVRWALDSGRLSRDILRRETKARRGLPRRAHTGGRGVQQNLYLKPNEQFDLANIKAEASRVDLLLKRRGYYYFSPDYIKAFVDTTAGDHRANIFLSIKKETPLLAKTPQRINSIMIFPNYTLLTPPPDTSKSGLTYFNGILIRDTVNNFKPSTLTRSVTYDTGSLYNVRRHNETLNRFINMGSFKFVKSRYEPSSDSVNPSRMDVYYYLTPLRKKTISAEIGGFTKTNSFIGSQVNVNWKNRNVFKGAEQLNIKGYGSFELSLNDSLKQNNNWRVGGEVSLLIPRFVTPFKIKENTGFPPYTKFTLGYEWMRRQLLFTKNFFRLQYDLSWKTKVNSEHTLSPASITFNNTTAFSAEYLQKVNMYPVLRYANLPELLLGGFYSYSTYTRRRQAKNSFYFNGSIDAAGNIAGLFNKADTAFSKKIAGGYFAQFVKFDADFRYTRKLAGKTSWANKIAIGAGIPYGNSAYIPFSKQFIIGGANSLRGFRPRQLGPGRVITTADQQVSYPQIGADYKLELQTELRFPIISIFNGVVFADAGNIWMKNDLLYGTEGKFTSKFLKDIAVDAGAGLRVDVKVIIIRLDLAVPLRKPFLARGSEWVTSKIDVSSRSWRRDNLIFNIGIGYPF
jgi:outer membrane protein insertion porin family